MSLKQMLLGLAFAFGIAGAASAQQPRASSLEAGVYIEFGASFVDYQNVVSADQCRSLCVQDTRCKVWRYISSRAPAEYGRARRVCVLGDGAAQSRENAGAWVSSGVVQ
jgi:hypothetical protein